MTLRERATAKVSGPLSPELEEEYRDTSAPSCEYMQDPDAPDPEPSAEGTVHATEQHRDESLTRRAGGGRSFQGRAQVSSENDMPSVAGYATLRKTPNVVSHELADASGPI